MSENSPRWTHSQKVEFMLVDLPAKGVSQYTAAPPLFRVLWKLGIKVPPPLFLSFAANAILMSGFFAVTWGLVMWFSSWRLQNMTIEAAVLLGLLAGALCGPAMAWYLGLRASKLDLPPWQDYGPPT